ncbi:MAG: glutamate--tRNA ligase [Proteobacteria bacterium]|nr:glutamate--tRNA ligase [Pseudomonadota bacterium]
MTVRVRFAPSPTGFMHLGNARTALFNWLYARHVGGEFILRIEDTDRERHTEAAVQVIYDSLKWMGLNWDGPVLRQSERLHIYHEVAERLIAEGKAYRCNCTREELEAKKEAMKEATNRACYDRTCRDKNLGPDCGTHVIRFKMPLEGESTFDDLIQGTITKSYKDLDDFIMVRSDGMPTYQFAVVVDDLALQITHVIRGADHIDNTHCQIALYHALGKEPPRFGHAPRIDGLSKRKGSPSVEYYREALGLLPEGLNNYIARLGWSHGDEEIFTMKELVEKFDICDVNRANGEFDEEKLKWVNEQQLRIVPIEEIAEHTIPKYEKAGVKVEAGEWLYKLLEMMRKRAHNLNEIVNDSLFIWNAPESYDEASVAKHFNADTPAILGELEAGLNNVSTWDEASIEAAFTAVATARGVKMGKIAQPARTAIVGIAQSPGIYEVVWFVGKEETCRRLRKAAEFAASSV